jgi:hypothetical protein
MITMATSIANQHTAAAAIVNFTAEDVKEDGSASERCKEGADCGIDGEKRQTTALWGNYK